MYRRLGIGEAQPKGKKEEPEEKTLKEQMVSVETDEDLQKEIMDMFFKDGEE